MALSAIASQQSAPTEETLACINRFLDYIWTHPDAKIRYRASNMILNVHSNVSYLSAPKAQSCAGGYVFLNSIPQDSKPIIINGTSHTSHAQSENLLQRLLPKPNLALLFSMHRKLKYYSLSLKNSGTHNCLRHLFTSRTQPPLALPTTQSKDNSPKPWRCGTFWLLDGEVQKLIRFYYQPGRENIGVYLSKHHSSDIHHHVHPCYVHMNNSPTVLS
jgi:hypothetical protein